jgi:hypothetical protein
MSTVTEIVAAGESALAAPSATDHGRRQGLHQSTSPSDKRSHQREGRQRAVVARSRRATCEDALIELERRYCDAVRATNWAECERILAPGFFALIVGRTRSLETISRAKWLNGMRSGRIPLFQTEDLMVCAHKNFALVTLLATRAGSIVGETTRQFLVTDLWVRTAGWMLMERHISELV